MNKIKGFLERKDNEIIGIASSESGDRDGEIIRQEGWDLKNFEMNPVLLASHNYYEFPIGRVTELKIEGGRLYFKAIFSEATQKAREAYAMVKEGVLNTFSVGFIPRQYDANDSSIITRAELLEISLVSVPANAEAVVIAKGMKENTLANALVKYWAVEKELEEGETAPVETVVEPVAEETPEKKSLKALTDIHAVAIENNTLLKEITANLGNKSIGKDGDGRSIAVEDEKLLKRTTGLLQELCHSINRKDGEKI